MSGLRNSGIYSIIIVLSKYRLSLARLDKPNNVRVYVVAPPRMLYDETGVDVYYQVELPMSENDVSPMLHKARELASIYSTTQVRIVAFERSLQRSVAKLRFEMDIEGFNHEQIEMLFRLREASQVARRSGLITPKTMNLCGSAAPEIWTNALHSQMGGYPLYVRPARDSTDHTRSIVGVTKLLSDDDFRHWIRRVYACSPPSEWVLEECFEDGLEFVVMCTSVAGLIYCISSTDHERTLFDSIYHQRPYALHLYTVDQTRDIMPGLESFVMQATKALFSKHYTGAIFIRGFYKSHNDIFLLGVDLEPSCECIRALIALPRGSPGWEAISIHSLYAVDATEFDYASSSGSHYHGVVNAPTQEGVLLHQTTIPKRRTTGMRVSWRASEAQELKDSDGLDGNVVQIFMWNSENGRLLSDVRDVISRLDLPIDRNPIAERNAAYRRHLSRLGTRGEFVRSCTTTD